MALYELRTYHCHPGKLKDLLNRFRTHTTANFERQGLENLGSWVPGEGSQPVLYCLFRHRDKPALDSSWQTFHADPEWQEFDAGGTIVSEVTSRLMTLNTTLSPEPQWSSSPTPRLFEMRIYDCLPGKYADLIRRFKDHALSLFEKHGMTNLAYFDTHDGSLLYFRTHPDEESSVQSLKNFRTDPQWRQVVEDSERAGQIVEKMTGLFLVPVDFSPIQ